MEKVRVVIVGAGFAGIAAVKRLSRYANVHVTIISNREHFEYYPALYRVVVGRSPSGVCIPLGDIFDESVDLSIDRMDHIDEVAKIVIGESGSHYHYDYLILALGSETNYFGVIGMCEFSYGFKSINEALELKNHLHQQFQNHATMSPEELRKNLTIVIVGGGATGVEVAADMAIYAQKLAISHSMDPKNISIMLLEAGPRLSAFLPEDMSAKIRNRLMSLGVQVLENQRVEKQEEDRVYVNGKTIMTSTVIWAAGVKPNKKIATLGFQLEKNGRVTVDEFLRPFGKRDIFVIGDNAATKYSGLAQTAIHNARFVALHIHRVISNKKEKVYVPKKNSFAIPVGGEWAVVYSPPIKLYSWMGYIVRIGIDFMYFVSILSVEKAFTLVTASSEICETCLTCISPEQKI